MRKIGIGVAIGTVLALSIMELKKRAECVIKKGKSMLKKKVDEALD